MSKATLNTCLLSCRAVELPVAAEAPEWLMYMPAGKQEISAMLNGKAAELTVIVDVEAATVLQAGLAAALASGEPEPFFGFNHVNGEAAAWPREFRWEEGKGIMARCVWTPKGREAVTAAAGQLPAWRYFSPSFYVDKKSGKITGLQPAEAGSLVNDPAFRAIAKVTARDASGGKDFSAAPAEPNQNNEDMKHKEIAEAVVKAGLLTEQEAAGDNAAELLANKVTALNAAAVKAKSATQDSTELAAVQARLTALEAEVKAAAAADGAAAVAAAKAKSAILPQDSEGAAWWLEQCSQPGKPGAAARARLAALPSLLPQDSGAGAKARQTPGDAPAESAAVEARAAAVLAKAHDLRATHPHADFNTRYQMAEGLVPPASA